MWDLGKKIIRKEILTDKEYNFWNILESDEEEIILCIGQVQSGKTKKIIEIIRIAIELKYDYIIYLGGNTNLLLNQTQIRLEKDLIEYTTSGKLKILGMKYSDKSFNKNIPVLFNILKNSKTIDNLRRNIFESLVLKDKKILIIDDEVDFGSINTDKIEKPSVLYTSIENLFNRFHNSKKLLQVTATPYGNILSSNSISLKAKKIISWKPSNGYTGWNYFNEKRETIYNIYLENDIDSNDNLQHVILRNSIITHFIASYNLYFEQKDKSELKNINSDLLINWFLETKKQEKIEINCFKIIRSMKEIPNIFYDNYLKKLLIDKDKFNEFVKKYTNEIEIVVLNSENKEIGNKTYKIIIGGHLLSRGNTFENLMVELFLNTPSDAVHVDTLLQRCRWFGYREEYRVKHMKILMDRKIFNALEKCGKYIDLFQEGEIKNIPFLESELIRIDKELGTVRGTNSGKSK